MTFSDYFHGILLFSGTLGLAAALEKSQNYPCFMGIFDPTQCNRHKLRTSPKRMSLPMFNLMSVSYFPSFLKKRQKTM